VDAVDAVIVVVVAVVVVVVVDMDVAGKVESSKSDSVGVLLPAVYWSVVENSMFRAVVMVKRFVDIPIVVDIVASSE